MPFCLSPSAFDRLAKLKLQDRIKARALALGKHTSEENGFVEAKELSFVRR